MKWALRGLAAVLVLSVAGVLIFILWQPIKVLPRITLAPALALVDQDARPFSNEDLRGGIVLYTVMATRCTAPCPDTAGVMREVQRRLGEVDTGGLPVHLVSVSLDPQHDTPTVLRRAAAAAGADPARWRFATGDADRLKYAVGGGFQLYYGPGPDGGFEFDPGYFLVDGWGLLRAEYRTPAPDVAIILRDIGLLADEARNSVGVARYAYEAAHLFLCYPR